MKGCSSLSVHRQGQVVEARDDGALDQSGGNEDRKEAGKPFVFFSSGTDKSC